MESNQPNHYEFDANETILVGKIAKTMRFVSIGFIVFGVIAFLKAFTPFFLPYGVDTFALVYDLAEAGFNIAIALFTLQVSKAFALVASETGNDHSRLMSALKSLAKMQTAQLVLLILGTLVFVINWGKLLSIIITQLL